MKKINSFASIPFLVSVPLLLQAGFRMPWWGWVILFAAILAIVIFLIRSGDRKDVEDDLDAEIPLEENLVNPLRTGTLSSTPVPSDELEQIAEEDLPLNDDLNLPPRTGVLSSEPLAADELERTTEDDLTIIEGIGPKISDFLRRQGVTTYRQLAGMNMTELDRMLADANFGIANPETWAQQAELADEGRWDDLKTLQDHLKGGRQVD